MAYNDTQTGRTDTVAFGSVPMQKAVGTIVYDATAITATDYSRFAVGFKPKYICFANLTDGIQGEWYEGMTASQILKTAQADGARTLNTTASCVVVDDRGFSILQNASLGLILAEKTCVFHAHG